MTEATPINRSCKEYFEGSDAFHEGADMDAWCPYSVGDHRRVIWMTGFLDARTNRRLAGVFKRWRVHFP